MAGSAARPPEPCATHGVQGGVMYDFFQSDHVSFFDGLYIYSTPIYLFVHVVVCFYGLCLLAIYILYTAVTYLYYGMLYLKLKP